MNPFDRMEAWYADAKPEGGKEEFHAGVAYYLRHGYVFGTHEYFVMGRPIKLMPTRALTGKAISFRVAFPSGEWNCWYMHSLSGDLSRVWKVLPYDLPWIAFHRLVRGKFKLSVYPMAAFRRRAMLLDSSKN